MEGPRSFKSISGEGRLPRHLVGTWAIPRCGSGKKTALESGDLWERIWSLQAGEVAACDLMVCMCLEALGVITLSTNRIGGKVVPQQSDEQVELATGRVQLLASTQQGRVAWVANST